MAKTPLFRIEKDTLGEMKVPAKAYYGIQTLRASENFRISGIRPKPEFVKATAMIKLSAAMVNSRLNLLDKKRASAMEKAAKEVMEGRLADEFIVDVYQAGAGTSHNMNVNEVIANRALELLGQKRGDYSKLHPNDHVNMAQSTNDVFPTAMRLAAVAMTENLLGSLSLLESELRKKAREFKAVVKSGRTHLQDAVPITLGAEFLSYADCVKRRAERIKKSSLPLKSLGIGGTAVGTGLNAHPRYAAMMVKTLSSISGIKGLRRHENAFEATNSMADFVEFSSALRALAIELIRISNDIRLLSSGPRTGLSEIKLPATQPGSSIMPGKVNPVMAEMLAMVSFQVMGNDLAIAMAAQAGQLELNVMMPVINYNALQSIEILANATEAFAKRCVRGIAADKKRCLEHFEKSAGLATVLNPVMGYEKAAMVAKEAAKRNVTIRELVMEKGILEKAALRRILNMDNLIKAVKPGKRG
ncbi:MAG TPA: aspartate ammonia-lyase [Thermodesulfobacteriota bacterium]|nr:aspartate ammonia-lyase [Thermodesulfobacteriota bacterium]